MKKLGLKHYNYLTDEFGIWQHTRGNSIDCRHGYALDDAARALILSVKLKEPERVRTFIDFIDKSVMDGFIVNFFGAKKNPLSKPWSEDALGETYWALSECIVEGIESGRCKKIIKNIAPLVRNFSSIRGKSYSLIGASQIDLELANDFSRSLEEEYKRNRSEDWYWIEDEFSYANAIIPMAFLYAGESLKKPFIKHYGLVMLNFLNDVTKVDGIPIAIGNKGWYRKDKRKTLYDQQPIDPAYQVLANLKAWELTFEERYLDEAKTFFQWFWGNNIEQKPMVDLVEETCKDGLQKGRVDRNCGAESIVCYLLAQEAIWPYLSLQQEKIYNKKSDFFHDLK